MNLISKRALLIDFVFFEHIFFKKQTLKYRDK